MDDREPNLRRRDTIVTLTLFLFIGGVLVFFLNLVSLGLFTYVIAAALVLTVVGFLHYVLWGYALSEEVAEERDRLLREEERREAEVQQGIQDLSGRRRR